MAKLTPEQRSDRMLLLIEWLADDGLSALSDEGTKALAELRADRAARRAEEANKEPKQRDKADGG